MKRTCCLVALSLLSVLCLPALAQETSSQLSAASLPDRPATEDNAQLLGHWVANNGSTHYYFGQDEVIIVNELRRRDNSIVQHKQKLAYAITAVQGDWIQLELQTPLDWAEIRFLRLADDRRSLTELMEVMGHSFRNQWTYVSDRQQP
ncbi:hypothetical protein H6F67_09290 [Microcoleus sp. FACHB-1515]|uniref:hypothetical protein n=1 Tax=Cyanophyceae TaxID=3028117 RepID=UPI0016834C51|nr:hypothetical protein [Microcoleus sp. FACHB-1515]MBD2090045.1 hypothetical protein [Microcoleus sp. FACHB-1515]